MSDKAPEALRAFAESVATTVEAAEQAREARTKGGQQVPYHGDFAHVAGSTARELRWWANAARAALEGVR